MFNHHDITRDACMLHGPLTHHGYDWWWHSFTAQDAETGEDKPFFIEFFRPERTSRFLLSFLFATLHWQKRSLFWDNYRRTGLQERNLPTSW